MRMCSLCALKGLRGAALSCRAIFTSLSQCQPTTHGLGVVSCTPQSLLGQAERPDQVCCKLRSHTSAYAAVIPNTTQGINPKHQFRQLLAANTRLLKQSIVLPAHLTAHNPTRVGFLSNAAHTVVQPMRLLLSKLTTYKSTACLPGHACCSECLADRTRYEHGVPNHEEWHHPSIAYMPCRMHALFCVVSCICYMACS